MTAIAQHSPEGIDAEHLSIITGYKRRTRDDYLSRLRPDALISRNEAARFIVTDEGKRRIGAYAKLPTGDQLRAHYLATLPKGERDILRIVCQFFPHVAPRDRLGELAGFKRRTRDDYLSRLKTRRLVITYPGGTVSASERLFDVPDRERARAQS